MYKTGDLASWMPDGNIKCVSQCLDTLRQVCMRCGALSAALSVQLCLAPRMPRPGSRAWRYCCRYIGRADGQVKLRGFRLELEEVEAVVASTPGVQDAVAILQVCGNVNPESGPCRPHLCCSVCAQLTCQSVHTLPAGCQHGQCYASGQRCPQPRHASRCCRAAGSGARSPPALHGEWCPACVCLAGFRTG